MLALLVTLMGGWLACGGSPSSPNCGPLAPDTTPGAYSITVTGAIVATGTIRLSVH